MHFYLVSQYSIVIELHHDVANESTATIPTSDSNLLLECKTDLKYKSSSSTDSVTAKVMFADKERARRSRHNKRYKQNLKKGKLKLQLLISVIKKKNTPYSTMILAKVPISWYKIDK